VCKFQSWGQNPHARLWPVEPSACKARRTVKPPHGTPDSYARDPIRQGPHGDATGTVDPWNPRLWVRERRKGEGEGEGEGPSGEEKGEEGRRIQMC
jgi:hypothetical protein